MSKFSIQRILVPIDLSETSLNALDTAVALAVKHGASLDILNVIEPGPESFLDSGYSSLNQTFQSSDIIGALAGAIQHANEIEPKIIQVEGNVADNIIRIALSQQASLVVMGSHGASGFRDGFVGSNTYAVVKQASCPVLIIPGRKKFSSFSRLLFPVRPVSNALSRFDVVNAISDSAAKMDVLGLSYRNMERETGVLEKVVDEIRDELNETSIQTRTVWGKGSSIADDVLEHAQQQAPDLVVVTSVLDAINKPNYLGPHAQKIIHCLRTPVLCIKKMWVPILA